MNFVIKKPNETVVTLARKIGYRPMGLTDEEYNIVRPLAGGDYPRFHIYVKKNRETGVFYFNLHLDQKQPSYEGTAAHSGEYEGELVENEANRIKKIIEEIK